MECEYSESSEEDCSQPQETLHTIVSKLLAPLVNKDIESKTTVEGFEEIGPGTYRVFGTCTFVYRTRLIYQDSSDEEDSSQDAPDCTSRKRLNNVVHKVMDILMARESQRKGIGNIIIRHRFYTNIKLDSNTSIDTIEEIAPGVFQLFGRFTKIYDSKRFAQESSDEEDSSDEPSNENLEIKSSTDLKATEKPNLEKKTTKSSPSGDSEEIICWEEENDNQIEESSKLAASNANEEIICWIVQSTTDKLVKKVASSMPAPNENSEDLVCWIQEPENKKSRKETSPLAPITEVKAIEEVTTKEIVPETASTKPALDSDLGNIFDIMTEDGIAFKDSELVFTMPEPEPPEEIIYCYEDEEDILDPNLVSITPESNPDIDEMLMLRGKYGMKHNTFKVPYPAPITIKKKGCSIRQIRTNKIVKRIAFSKPALNAAYKKIINIVGQHRTEPDVGYWYSAPDPYKLSITRLLEEYGVNPVLTPSHRAPDPSYNEILSLMEEYGIKLIDTQLASSLSAPTRGYQDIIGFLAQDATD